MPPIEEAVYIHAVKDPAADIVNPVEIDRAWMIGTSLDQGPFGVLRTMGSDAFIVMLEGLVAAGGFSADDAALVRAYLQNNA